VATAVTDAAGRAASAAVPLSAGSYRATTTAVAAFPTAASGTTSVTVTPSACATALRAALSDDHVMAGQQVTVSGTLTRTLLDGSSSGAAGEQVGVELQPTGSSTWTRLAAATTTADGSFSVVVRPKVTGALRVSMSAKTAYQASASPVLHLTVSPWRTAVTASLSADSVMASAPVVVSGTLSQSDGTDTGELAGQPVVVSYPVVGGRRASARAVSRTDGSYSLTVRPTGSGTVAASYAGTVGWDPSSESVPLTVTAWQTALTARASATSVAPSTPVTVSGTLTRTGAGSTTPYASATVAVTYPTTPGRVATVTARTTSTGTFSVVVRPGSSGAVQTRFAGVVGVEPADAPPVDLTVG
jgi:hypothetical protein